MSNSANACGRILVVDDEPDLRTVYELALLREGHEVAVAADLGQAQQAMARGSFDLLITDMRLPDGLGLDLLAEAVARCWVRACVVITAYGSADNAVRALKAGAFDYLTKPVDLQQLRAVVRSALQAARDASLVPAASVRSTLPVPGSPPSVSAGAAALDRMAGHSDAMRSLKNRVQKVAQTMAPVLIQGESGTGKELAARAIHECSPRRTGPFVAVNCGAIPENLLETEFFGARKGAYTGAVQDRDGFFQAASGGTLFLDEIGDLPLSMQSKLLRAIQERTIRPVGGTGEVTVDVRIVSATHKQLGREVDAARFRQDLFYRLNVIELYMPALRERKEDLDLLCEVVLQRLARESGWPLQPLSQSARQWLWQYDFPGNVRELENILHRAHALSEGGELQLAHACEASAAAHPERDTIGVRAEPDSLVPDNLEAHLDAQERRILIQALQDCGYNRTAAAQRLGITLRKMRYRMERLQIPVPQGAPDDPAGQEV